jgi:hypothetical protein
MKRVSSLFGHPEHVPGSVQVRIQPKGRAGRKRWSPLRSLPRRSYRPADPFVIWQE